MKCLIQKGFTLMELIVVIIIIGVLSAAVYASWPGKTVNANLVAHQIASDIRYAQTLSLNRDRNYMLEFSTSSSPVTYQIKRVVGASQTAVAHPFTNTTTITLPDDVQVAFSGASGSNSGLPNDLIYFNGDGEPFIDATGSNPLTGIAQITVTGDGNSFYLCMHPNSGLVEVQKVTCS